MKINVLDHGYVRLIECVGQGEGQGLVLDADKDYERGIIEAARQSTNGGFKGWEFDKRLLAYLYNNKHSTPFEFAGMVIEVKAPVFIFREWHRHRTQSYNEMSSRYIPIPNVNYMPSIERLMINASKTNKQAGTVKGSKELTEEYAKAFQVNLKRQYDTFESNYQDALAEGIPKEVARVGMPVGRYSQMRAITNLRNWIAFLTLRQDPAAQWEIRQFANAVAKLIGQQFPKTYELYLNRD